MANRPSSSVKDRRWKRVPLDVRVKAVIMEDERKTVIYGRSAQLSEGGMGVTMTREMPKGTIATMIFKLPGEQDERVLQAEVKYRSGFRCGLEFLGISAEGAQGIAALLHRGLTGRPAALTPSRELSGLMTRHK